MFSPGTPVSSTIKIYAHDITEVLFTVALNINNDQYSTYGRRGRYHKVVGFTTTLSPLHLWVQISFISRCTRYNILR